MKTTRVSGFTLVEVAIVLVIVGLLLGGLLMPLATQIEKQRIEETKKTLEEIKEALIGYTIANGHLPCPATAATPNTTAGAGTAPTTCVGAAAQGVVPWIDLGVSETDAWGRRFTYRVTPLFADNDNTTLGCTPATTPTASFALCSAGNINVTDGANPVVSGIFAVIVSHGKNGFGAYLPSGTQMAASGTADELENSDIDGIFIDRAHSSTGSPNGEFDDIVSWVVPGILFNRIVAARVLP